VRGLSFALGSPEWERELRGLPGQPFRSMGFVSVIIVSVLFALGLPLVLLQRLAEGLGVP